MGVRPSLKLLNFLLAGPTAARHLHADQGRDSRCEVSSKAGVYFQGNTVDSTATAASACSCGLARKPSTLLHMYHFSHWAGALALKPL